MRRNITKIPLLVVASLFCLTCCGEADNNGNGNNNGNNDPFNKTSLKDVQIDFWYTFGDTIEAGVKDAISAFEQLVKTNDGVNLKVNTDKAGGYSEIYSKIDQGISTGNIPTLAVAYPDHVASYLDSESKDGEIVVKLDQYINDSKIGFGKEAYLGDKKGANVYDKDDIISCYLDEGVSYSKEGTYSLPFMKSTEAMIYNLTIVNKAMQYYKPEIYNRGSEIETFMDNITWDQLVGLSRCIMEHKTDIAQGVEFPIFYDSDGNFFISSMYQNEIPYSSFDNDGRGKIDFESGQNYEKTVDMLEDLYALHTEGLLTTKGDYGQYSSNAFKDQKTVFSIGSTGGAGYNKPAASDSFELRVTKVPAQNNKRLYVSQGVTLTILRSGKYSDQENNARALYAWKLAKYLTNPEINAEICVEDSNGYVPVRYSAFETPDYTEFLSDTGSLDVLTANVVMDINTKGYYFKTPNFKGSAKLREQCGGIISDVFKKDTDIRTALDTAIQTVKAAL